MDNRELQLKRKLAETITTAISQAFGGMIHLSMGVLNEQEMASICYAVLAEQQEWFRLYLKHLGIENNTLQEIIQEAIHKGERRWDRGKTNLEKGNS